MGIAEPSAVLDLEGLGLDGGGSILLAHALRGISTGERLSVRGRHPALSMQLGAWCRTQGHLWLAGDGEGGLAGHVVRGSAEQGRWRGAERTGHADRSVSEAVADHPQGHWGLAARGALVEAGTPDFGFPLADKNVVWAEEAGQLYAQGVAAQWDPDRAITWTDPGLPESVEDAVVQVMTYLIENETAALMVPARFVAQLHPHFREVMQLLALQAADEARHIEVFTRRAVLTGREPGTSSVGGQLSLKTLVDEPDFALSSFLLSVMGEGTFLTLLRFLAERGPDPVTREVTRLAAQDESRHVAFGLAHLRRHVTIDRLLRGRLAASVEQRHNALQHTSGLNADVFDALVVIAAGSWAPDAIRRGFEAVVALEREMHAGRTRRLAALGFGEVEAERLAGLHTRNFM